MSLCAPVLSLLVLAAPPDAAPAAPSAAAYEILTPAAGVFVFRPAASRSGIVSGNTTAVVGDDGVLVFDAGNFPSATRRIVADIARLTGKPVRFLVNSHWHFDHALGNAVYRDAHPGLTIVAHAFTRGKMIENFDAFGKGAGAFYAQDAPRLRAALAQGKNERGQPLDARERELFAARLHDEEAVAPDYREARLEAPELTFEGALSVHLGNREVRLLHLGRGNTAGDVMAYVPDVRLLVSGDVLVAPTPYGYGSYPAEWIAVLKQIDQLDVATVVPGHGPLLLDREYPHTLIALLESLREQVGRLVAAGATREQLTQRVDVEAFRKKLAGDDAIRRGEFDEFFLAPILDRAYQETQGQLAPE